MHSIAEVLQAERHDQAGRHAEAVDCLVAGVRKDDVESLTRLGKRLLIGDRAPNLPSDGAHLLRDAAGRGGAEAAAVMAVLLGVGMLGRPDIDAALASLVLAAQRGWQPAQA